MRSLTPTRERRPSAPCERRRWSRRQPARRASRRHAASRWSASWLEREKKLLSCEERERERESEEEEESEKKQERRVAAWLGAWSLERGSLLFFPSKGTPPCFFFVLLSLSLSRPPLLLLLDPEACGCNRAENRKRKKLLFIVPSSSPQGPPGRSRHRPRTSTSAVSPSTRFPSNPLSLLKCLCF